VKCSVELGMYIKGTDVTNAILLWDDLLITGSNVDSIEKFKGDSKMNLK
jgi:hypothetical protein